MGEMQQLKDILRKSYQMHTGSPMKKPQELGFDLFGLILREDVKKVKKILSKTPALTNQPNDEGSINQGIVMFDGSGDGGAADRESGDDGDGEPQ